MDIVVPAVGESVFEALIAKWHKQDGDTVALDEKICEIETDKITLELTAEAAGTLHVTVTEGTTVKIGAVIGAIDTQAQAPGNQAPAVGQPATAPPAASAAPRMSPAARKLVREKGIAPDTVEGSGRGGRVTAEDLMKEASAPAAVQPEKQIASVHTEEPPAYGRTSSITRKRMTPIRKRIAERLMAARQQTAMLTTFNEADMTRVLELRRTYGEQFQRRHGVKLGFMPFFVKASCEALAEFTAVNASIEGDDLVFHHYYDIGIAVSGEKGLVVPVLRGADRLRFAEIEQTIREFTAKVSENRLAISDLEGGTFTITNGGIFGSMLSTPILNPPQSAVLGMHAIQERPVARDGQVVIRPMMYLALSYDHRIIDGREAVLFLKKVKELIEQPEEMLLES